MVATHALKHKLQYLGFSVFTLLVCVLLFSSSRPGERYIYNTSGEKIDLKKINFHGTVAGDTVKNSGSLDGDQNIIKPEMSGKPFDPNAPFNKLTFKLLRTYIPGKTLPEEIDKLNENNVEIMGFMTPLNALEGMEEFLLCSAPPLSCFCAPPIFINEIIYVKMIRKKTDFKTGAVKIKGQFRVNKEIKDEYTDIIYTINASEIE